MHQHFLQFDGKKLARALDALEHDVAAVAVGDDHIAAARERGVGLDVADEVEVALLAGLLKAGVGLMTEGVALARLGANVQKSDARLHDAEHLFGIIAA